MTVAVGSSVLLECFINVSEPPLEVKDLNMTWTLNKRVLVSYITTVEVTKPWTKMELGSIKQGNVSVFLTNVTKDHDGIYKCEVNYKQVRDSREITLQVEVFPDLALVKSGERLKMSVEDSSFWVLIAMLVGVLIGLALCCWYSLKVLVKSPMLLLLTMQLTWDRRVRVTCAVNGATLTSEISWWKKIQKVPVALEDSEEHKIERSGPRRRGWQYRQTSVLTYTPTHEPGGKYICRVNRRGPTSTGEQAPDRIEVVMPQLVYNEPDTLTCSIKEYQLGIPTVTWLKKEDGNEVSLKGRNDHYIETAFIPEPTGEHHVKTELIFTRYAAEDLEYICKVYCQSKTQTKYSLFWVINVLIKTQESRSY
ncbi:uncharacterized protein LOC102351255 [Latimeria chalumnae]|uniref:uncharacterized protein LOC102351255 n=1 Tax=Latimeria chalumnae TaxID=7897 RepID=UPI00313BFAF7